ncbi:type II toxin-antitoxin system HicB family antitoxin [Faecalicatena sp. AGMB00832]|uniref:Type II toxin-antitoxin system HicB family antitoxin n=1 Tax=Faecalicatena faecalis TaxID=2726362 RepID=A0ABS6D1K4_9FIRM|nr:MULTISPECIES: type II toxin-antitoxin system HicB family antitoxin [Faecalicatena]MBU3875371.1 type II toxin-antitoxin system HicB family antitoxin [Faecalicatena faecalis]MCI6468071.1 type II toxin-antitoxin system HicB family antitoxin [Faecalicatena sp.]MDY5618549.1 type II toxin-antitoxin system HicB family antitoxin [Lachnospiraceae bacterium]
MSNCMKYKDYYGTVEYSDEDECFHGKVLGINGLVTFEGNSVQELKASFQEMVEEYLADCEARHITPEKNYKGSFNIRITPELHKKAALCAANEGLSLNALVEKAISFYTGKYFAK